jgi:tight junction protein 1
VSLPSFSSPCSPDPCPRAPEPQKPHPKDEGRPNHFDPDEDEEYYRKQLSYFDRRSFDSKAMSQPGPAINRFHDMPKPGQLSYHYNRSVSSYLGPARPWAL